MNGEQNERKNPRFWIVGAIAEAYGSAPILTTFLLLGFLAGAVFGAQLGLGWGDVWGLVIGAPVGGVAGVLAILILWGVLAVFGLAG